MSKIIAGVGTVLQSITLTKPKCYFRSRSYTWLDVVVSMITFVIKSECPSIIRNT
jgi:hypothetical protein